MIMMNWGAHPQQVTWKDGYRDILAIHSKTVQRFQAALGVSGHGQDLDGLSIPRMPRSTTLPRGLLVWGLTNDGLCHER
jgi:hypothetical protein